MMKSTKPLLILLVVFSLTILLVVSFVNASIDRSCSDLNNEVSITSGAYGGDGINVVLASGCKVSIKDCQATKITFSGEVSATTEVLIDGVSFSDDTSQTVTTASYITSASVSGTSVKSIRVLNCRINRDITAANTAVTILWTIGSSSLLAADVEFTGNQISISGMKSSFIAGVFSCATQLRITNSFAIHNNRVVLTSASTHTADATPAVFITSIAGAFLSQINLINITKNSFLRFF